ncbi:hypothetical protein [Pedobacter sp. L105]|uniref:hypothetical protein n=1 Tax=Pedobacter sp. L105 TaxID=1641871 RepID=UPI00131B5191|nr:hypothetical protein [Pedobacter sp. L105]
MTIHKIITAVCILIAAVAVGYAVYQHSHKVAAIDNTVKNTINAEAKLITKKIDKNGVEHTILEETNNVLPKDLMTSNVGYDTAFVDSLIRMTDIQKKEIVSLTQINQTIQGKNLQAVQTNDSLKRRMYTYTDKNLYVSYTPDIDTAKTGFFSYKYNQNLNVIQYNRKKWFLGEDHKYIDVASDDPNSTVNGVKKLTVPASEKDFGIKLAARTVYLPQNGHVGAGAQLRVKWGKVTGTGSELYFPQSQHWLPVLGLEYNFFSY